MKTILLPLLATLAGIFRSSALLQLEILALRQQLAMITQRDRKRLRFRCRERLFWVWLYRVWPGCLQTLHVFKADTLVHWHRKGFRLYWTWRSRRRRGGRRPIAADVRELIRLMSRENVGWGAPRIHGELRMLGRGPGIRFLLGTGVPGSVPENADVKSQRRKEALFSVCFTKSADGRKSVATS